MKRIKILPKDEAVSLIKQGLLRKTPLFIAKRWRNYTDRYKFVYVIEEGRLVMYYYVRIYHRYNYDGSIRPSKHKV